MPAKQINGREFDIEQITGRKALQLSFKVVKLGGPALVKAASAVKGGSKEDNAKAVAAALPTLMNTNEESFFELVDAILACCKIKENNEYRKVNLDLHFNDQGGLTDLFKLLAEVISINFKHFFGNSKA